MRKIAFVIPWFAANIPGGAEMLCRGTTSDLKKRNVDVEILTTCIKQFVSDWSENYYPEGEEVINGVLCRRFPVEERDSKVFDEINISLMNDVPIEREDEIRFITEMIKCPKLYKYIREHEDEYTAFVYIPYMFSTSYFGVEACPSKAVMIPCFHEEAYAYMSIFIERFSKARAMIFNAKPEEDLAKRLYNLKNTICITSGCAMDVDINYDAEAFRKKFNINEPFILYAGRKDEGKNIYLLLKYFAEYKKRNDNDLKLVLIGGGEVKLPSDCKKDIIDLGYVDIEDKYNAHAAALLLCQPSIHESFSFVIMDSWLCGRPVIVHDGCDVTKNFAQTTNGGLYFKDYFEFEGEVNYIMNNPDIASRMGELGCKYVKENFSRDNVCGQYIDLFNKMAEEQGD